MSCSPSRKARQELVAKVESELEANPDKPFPRLKNDLLLRVLTGETVEKTPIWVHRQAGRYMKEYHEVRLENNFFTICQNPALACEVTLQPIDAFELDASIIFSDIMVIPQALGLEVVMVKGKGPTLPEPLTFAKDETFSRLTTDGDVSKTLGYVMQAITLTRHCLGGRVPLIGFSGAPWTLFCYMVEGAGSKSWSKAIRELYEHPEWSHQLLGIITDTAIEYLIAQVHAGAQALEVFDSWSGILHPDLFVEFCMPCQRRICEQVKSRIKNELGRDIPMTLFAKGSNFQLSELSRLGYNMLSIDWCICPSEARRRVEGRVCLQGNLDPCALYCSENQLRERVAKMMDSFGPGKHVVNLGHGMLPSHDPKKLEVFIDAVHTHQFSKKGSSSGFKLSLLFLVVGILASVAFMLLQTTHN